MPARPAPECQTHGPDSWSAIPAQGSQLQPARCPAGTRRSFWMPYHPARSRRLRRTAGRSALCAAPVPRPAATVRAECCPISFRLFGCGVPLPRHPAAGRRTAASARLGQSFRTTPVQNTGRPLRRRHRAGCSASRTAGAAVPAPMPTRTAGSQTQRHTGWNTSKFRHGRATAAALPPAAAPPAVLPAAVPPCTAPRPAECPPTPG